MSGMLSVIGLLVSSTGTAVLRKVLFQLSAPGLQGNVHRFSKPYFTAWESCIALVICLPIFWLGMAFQKRPAPTADVEQPLIGKEVGVEHVSASEVGAKHENGAKHIFHRISLTQFLGLSIPGLLNALAIIVAGIGLQYITATVMLMLSGSCIVFTAVLSKVLLKCQLNAYHILGITLAILGVLIVSAANLVFPSDPNANNLNMGAAGEAMKPDGKTLWGISLTLLSALFQAGRLVAEELALEDTNLHPFQVLGYEGIWGSVCSALVMYPIVWFIPGTDQGHRTENIVDSLVMLADTNLSLVNAFFFLTVVGMNVFGLFVTSRLGSVFRAVLLTARTASVWVVDLLLFYLHVGGQEFGESWSSPASYVQLGGFCLLLLGTIIYAQGSSMVVLLWSNTQQYEDLLGNKMQKLTKASAVTRLRPYTSLYIPNVPQRRLTQSAAIPVGSVPNEAVWAHRRPDFAITHSVPNNISLAVGPSRHQEDFDLETPRGLYPRTPQSPRTRDFSPSVQGASPQSISSGSFFMRSLIHKSSWIASDQEQPDLKSPKGQLQGQGRLRQDGASPSFELPRTTERGEEVDNPASADPGGNFTFPVDLERSQKDSKSNLAVNASQHTTLEPAEQFNEQDASRSQFLSEKLPGENSIQTSGLGQVASPPAFPQEGEPQVGSPAILPKLHECFREETEDHDKHPAMNPGEEEITPHSVRAPSPARQHETKQELSCERQYHPEEAKTASESPGSSKDLAKEPSKGTESSPPLEGSSDHSSGSGHVYGQSPTPEVLQERRSFMKSQRLPLAALEEDDHSEASTDVESHGDGKHNEATSDKDEDWTNVDSHRILFEDSDSDLSSSESDRANRRHSESEMQEQGVQNWHDDSSPGDDHHLPYFSPDRGFHTTQKPQS